MNAVISFLEVKVCALCFIALPVIYIISFASHPNLFNLKPVRKAEVWAAEFRHNKKLHFLHLLILGSTLLIINIALYLMKMLECQYEIFALIGGSLGIIGAVALAADKGALCLVPSAFDTLDDKQFQQLLPGLETLLYRKGYTCVLGLLILLPIGFIILAVGLILAKAIFIWQGVTLIIGMMFMINPDIDLFSLIGSCFMLISLGSIGISLLFA